MSQIVDFGKMSKI